MPLTLKIIASAVPCQRLTGNQCIIMISAESPMNIIHPGQGVVYVSLSVVFEHETGCCIFELENLTMANEK